MKAKFKRWSSWRPSHHPTGVVSGETTLDEGLYRVTITGNRQIPSLGISLASTDDRLSKVGEYCGRTIVQRAAMCLRSDTNSYDRDGCGIGGRSSVP